MRKDNFVGKPFSNLYRGLKIKPNSFTCQNFTYGMQTDFNFGKNILEIVWMNSPYDDNIATCKGEKIEFNSKKEFKI